MDLHEPSFQFRQAPTLDDIIQKRVAPRCGHSSRHRPDPPLLAAGEHSTSQHTGIESVFSLMARGRQRAILLAVAAPVAKMDWAKPRAVEASYGF
jgi:hypothetical protein